MGWDGIPMGYCPKGKERIMEATKGYTWEDEHRKVTLLDAALIGTTVYAAVEEYERIKNEIPPDEIAESTIGTGKFFHELGVKTCEVKRSVIRDA